MMPCNALVYLAACTAAVLGRAVLCSYGVLLFLSVQKLKAEGHEVSSTPAVTAGGTSSGHCDCHSLD